MARKRPLFFSLPPRAKEEMVIQHFTFKLSRFNYRREETPRKLFGGKKGITGKSRGGTRMRESVN